MLGAKKRRRGIRRERILIVEDDKNAAKLLEMTLHGFGFREIAIAGDGMEAWDHLKDGGNDHFDLVISDWDMPFATGIELLEHLRDMEINIPFIMLTGKRSIDFTIEASELGVTEYLTKPYSPEQIKDKVLGAMSKRGQ